MVCTTTATAGYQSVPTGGGYYIGEDPHPVPMPLIMHAHHAHHAHPAHHETVVEKIYYPQPEMATRLYLGGLTILGLYLLFRIAT